MSEFHTIIHAIGVDDAPSVSQNTLGSHKFACSFEDVTVAFETLPRMFLEPDGSFVWVTEEDGRRCQLDGLLTDDGTHLLHCELKGQCGNDTLDALLTAFGCPEQRVHFQLVQEGTYLSEAEFRERFML